MPAMNLQSIVCGVDFSKASTAALRTAAALAQANGGRLTVVFVDDPLLVAAAKAAHDSRGGPAPALAALKRFISQSLDEEPSVQDVRLSSRLENPRVSFSKLRAGCAPAFSCWAPTGRVAARGCCSGRR